MFPPRTPAPLPPPRPIGSGGPSNVGRVLAIVVGVLLLLAGVLLWPTFRALNGAIVEAIEDWRGLVGGAVLLFGGAVLASIVGMLVAIVRKALYKAQQAAMFKAPNGMPIHIRDVSAARRKRSQDGLAARLLEQSLTDYAAAKLAEAKREHPQLHSYHQVLHNQLPPPAEDQQTAPQLPQLPDSGNGTLAKLRQIGHVCRSGNSLLVGYSDGQPQYIELPECGFVGVGGKPRVGKSSTTLLMIEQAVLSGWHVLVGDPHIHKADGLLSRCKPFSGRLAKQATTPDEIAAMIYLADKIGRRRVRGDPDRTPVILVIDEFTNLVWRDEFPADIYRILPSMAIEYAGVGVHGVIISHDYSRAGLGNELGAALRRSFTHRIAHKLDPGNVEFLLPKGSAAQARAIVGLDRGQALYHGPDGSVTVTVPWLTDTDAAYAAQGVPERPYAPRALPAPAAPVAASPIPPTARVPVTPAPPTAPMSITIPEQILDLLAARSQWMTASEIASALRTDERVVRTEIKVLLDAGDVSRRRCAGRTTKELYEYQSTNQRVNGSTVLSA